jgi:hypothetical protein
MRHRIGLHLQITDGEGLVRIDQGELGKLGPTQGIEGPARHPHGQAVTPRQLEHAAGMIAVLMRHQDAGELLGIDLQARHTPDHLVDAESAVHQHQGLMAADQGTVAPTAAAQTCESQLTQ